jgi:malonyl-ACP O-methyltransferase BioC
MQKDLLKEKIRLSFNRAYNTYDNYCILQNSICEKLITQLKQYVSNTGSIVDLGCGTGNSTKLLIDNFAHKKIYAVDIADKLLVKAKHKLASYNVDILLADFEQILFKNHCIKLAFSNMSLQWSINFAKTLKTLHTQLADDGILAFSIPMNNTFFELKDNCKNTFYTYAEILPMLLNSGFKLIFFSNQFYKFHFDLPDIALRSIKMVGANCLLSKSFKNGLANKVNLNKIFKKEDSYSLTYHIGFFIVKKGSKNVT